MNMAYDRAGKSVSSETTVTSGGTTADTLEYLVDLVTELREMAEKNELKTLAAILALAELEAKQQRSALNR